MPHEEVCAGAKERPGLRSRDKPQNPLKDILSFERALCKYYGKQQKRKFLYYGVLVGAALAYVLYLAKRFFEELRELEGGDRVSKLLLYKVYFKMVGIIVLMWYVYIRFLRGSTARTKQINAQLRLLNLEFDGNRIGLCQEKTPKNIQKAFSCFRKEEKRRQERQWKGFRWYE